MSSDLKLIIANQNYSSWSLRPWILLKAKGIAFECEIQRFDEATNQRHFFEFSPTGKVPVLKHAGRTIWESLAIMEYLAELYPEHSLWPDDFAERAHARCIANEMHAGFFALREHCPMNMRRAPGKLDLPEQVNTDVARIEQIWQDCLDRSGGPFLFGAFTIADAMYAPVVNRFAIYQLSDHPAVQNYSQAMTALPAWQEWEAAGRAEPWIVEMDEA